MMVEFGRPVCICRGNVTTGSINGIPWSNNCAVPPPSASTSFLLEKERIYDVFGVGICHDATAEKMLTPDCLIPCSRSRKPRLCGTTTPGTDIACFPSRSFNVLLACPSSSFAAAAASPPPYLSFQQLAHRSFLLFLLPGSAAPLKPTVEVRACVLSHLPTHAFPFFGIVTIGLLCCHHNAVLLDADQDVPQEQDQVWGMASGGKIRIK